VQPRQAVAANGVTAWWVGEVKAPAYEGYRVVEKRRCPELASVALTAAAAARGLRFRRLCGERGVEHLFRAMAGFRAAMGTGATTGRTEESSEWPVVADRDAWRLYHGR